ncbi:quinone oxidoreductase [Colletotrichum plurivorum]|uniref:Dehydrogenase FUB6 n=1 Tax=Colletotrichum plurivorum TaxID=2175906 RepID=A0A8H6KX93_9PEZI|nr:quinone oxidoreductase [Colletotrichum plurivorum]
MPTKAKQWILREKPRGEPVLHGDNPTFQLREVPLPALTKGQLLLRILYFGNDPAQRNFISPAIPPERHYTTPAQVGDVMRATGIAEFLLSESPDVPVGSLVLGETGWADFAVADAAGFTVVKDLEGGLSVTHFLGALGISGFTAYYALTQVVKARREDAVVVSGAAGSVGMMAVQVAKKMIGCRKVIGIAGTDEKCRRVEKLGADVCLNYKSASFKEHLTKETEGFVEIYFDNVGGEILDLMLTRMAKFGRVAVCGSISNYNREDAVGIKNFMDVVAMRIQIQGIIMADWIENLPMVAGIYIDERKKGNIIIDENCETVVETAFEDIPRTWMMLFSGGNTGKLVTKLV